MPDKITSIAFADLGPVNPARTDRNTGEVWLNSRLIGRYPAPYWEYIIAHEEGHIKGNNRSEFVADAYASSKFLAKYKNQPFMSVAALKNVLPMNNPEHFKRVQAQTKRAATFDCNHNGNAASCGMAQSIPDNISNYTSSIGLNDISIIELVSRIKNRWPNVPIGNQLAKPVKKITAGDFLQAIRQLLSQSSYSDFVEGNCKKSEYACIQAETRRKQSADQLKQVETQAESLKYASDLDYRKSLATLYALSASDAAKQQLAKLQYDLELKKLAAAKLPPLDNKKIGLILLIAAAAFITVWAVTSTAQE